MKMWQILWLEIMRVRVIVSSDWRSLHYPMLGYYRICRKDLWTFWNLAQRFSITTVLGIDTTATMKRSVTTHTTKESLDSPKRILFGKSWRSSLIKNKATRLQTSRFCQESLIFLSQKIGRRGGSRVVWNLSENSSILASPGFPKSNLYN